MKKLLVEIKARCNDQARIREILKTNYADFKGHDHQIDTYFNVPHGKLKLREGNIENFLVHYDREDKKGPKKSDVILFASDPKSSLKELLSKALGILVVVDKQREIYFIDNVKFHLDTVEGLGNFAEIEAIDSDGSRSQAELLSQCEKYLKLFDIQTSELVSGSYSDLLQKDHDRGLLA